MASSRIAFTTALLLGFAGGVHGAEPPRPDAAAASGRDAPQAGPATGGPEDDAAPGLVRGAGDGCGVVPRFSREATFLGPSTGDSEKDSFGFRVVGHEGCPGGAIR